MQAECRGENAAADAFANQAIDEGGNAGMLNYENVSASSFNPVQSDLLTTTHYLCLVKCLLYAGVVVYIAVGALGQVFLADMLL